MIQHRDIAPEVLAAIAHHEAGHAVANVLAYREAHLPPSLRPSVKYASILREDDGKASGICFGSSVYRPEYASSLPNWRWQDAMEWQIVIDLAGGVAEAIHRGEYRQREMFWFVLLNCGTEQDLENAEAVCADLQALTGRRYGLQRFVRRALKLLLANRPAVKAIAAALIRDRYIDGSEIEREVAP